MQLLCFVTYDDEGQLAGTVFAKDEIISAVEAVHLGFKCSCLACYTASLGVPCLRDDDKAGGKGLSQG